jgi:plasmid stabilization system protein ParE
MRVILSPEAIEDLQRIRAYIARVNPTAGSRIAVQIVVACDRLEYLPNRGRPGREPGTREIVVRPLCHRLPRDAGRCAGRPYLAHSAIPAGN